MTASIPNTTFEQAAALIRSSNYAYAFTGAGISTPSGIPDFRSTHTGLWEQNDPMEVASLTAFRRHPEKFYNWLRPLAVQILQALPNPAHTGLARLEKAGLLKAVITQNIDGLQQKAGSKNVIEVHGSMTRLECQRCHRSYPAESYTGAFIRSGELPRCDTCRSILKPSITLFEEMLPQKAWDEAERVSRKADLVLVVGSSLEVTPAAYLPMYSLENGARLMIINLTHTPLDRQAELLLPGDAAIILPEILSILGI